MVKFLFLAILLISLVFVSGCSSNTDQTTDSKNQGTAPNQPQTDKLNNQPEEKAQNNQVASDLENQLTEKPWRTKNPYGSPTSTSKLVLKNDHRWEYGHKSSFSSGNWELKDLTEKDSQDLINFGYNISEFANQKIVLHGWHEKEDTIDVEAVIFLDKGQPWKLTPPTGEFIKDYNAGKNELT